MTSKKSHNIYIIYSESSIEDVRDFLSSYTNNNYNIGIMRLDYIKDSDGKSKKTNRILVTLTDKIYKKLKDNNLTEKNEYDFKIKSYELRNNNEPPENCAYTLYIKLPIYELTINECKEQLQDKINSMILYGLIDEDEYIFHSFEDKNYMLVTFPKLEKENTEKYIKFKILLDQQKFYKNNEEYIVRCSWAKKSSLREI